MNSPVVVETERLTIRRFDEADAAFVLELLNEPDFLRYIGDKGVRTLDDALRYIRTGPLASYEEHGFGPYLVARRVEGAPIGLCGILRRPGLDDPDLGFAFLAGFRGRGYALESAQAVLRDAHERLGVGRIVAITTDDNDASVRVLERLGFVFERMVKLPHADMPLRLYAAGS